MELDVLSPWGTYLYCTLEWQLRYPYTTVTFVGGISISIFFCIIMQPYPVAS